jgi:ferredoxin
MPTVSVRKRDEDGRPTAENEARIEAIVGENLFESLDNENYSLPHGCLNGACCACRIEVLEGHENLNFPKAKESESLTRFKANYESKHGLGSLKGKEIRLSCQTTITKKAVIVISPLN